ncbi:MAG TPA: LytR C-terminal domain-containing protein [Jatrophihabitans sp.]|nr:LytR C-terminal domain-containing protein [Jatrophihabitans sp.]
MSASSGRRPLPALAFLLALTILTAIVWWRVLHRPDGSATTSHGPTIVQPSICAPAGKPLTLPKPATITVTVLNGTQRYQLATQVTALLKARGFRVGTPNDAPSQLTGIGEIQFGPAGRTAATLLSYYLPGATMVAESRSGTALTLVLGAGYHALATPAAVTKSIAGAKKPC